MCARVCYCDCRAPPANNGYLEVVDHKAALIESTIPNNSPASALAANGRRHDFRFVLFFLVLVLVEQ